MLTCATLFGGCGGSGPSPRDQMIRAADRTLQERTAHVTLAGEVEDAGQHFRQEGDGVLDLEHGDLLLTYKVDVPNSDAEAQTMVSDRALYTRVSGGKWAVVPLVEAGGPISGGGTGARTYLRLLSAAGDVRRTSGPEVLGHSTSHYVATLDLDAIADHGPPGLRGLAAQELVVVSSPIMAVEVWVDEQDDVIRRARARFATRYPGATYAQRHDFTVTYDEFGVATDMIVAPPERDTQAVG